MHAPCLIPMRDFFFCHSCLSLPPPDATRRDTTRHDGAPVAWLASLPPSHHRCYDIHTYLCTTRFNPLWCCLLPSRSNIHVTYFCWSSMQPSICLVSPCVCCTRFSVHVKDVVTGEDLPDVVEWCKFGGITWEEGARGFFYSAFPRPKSLEVGTAQHSKHNTVDSSAARSGFRDGPFLLLILLCVCPLCLQ